MRIFKRKPKHCDSISYSYNYNKPEEGIIFSLGVGEDKILPGLPKREIAYIRFKVDDIVKLIADLRDIQIEYIAANQSKEKDI